ncbi:MAG: class I SAM-dependent methyltransferase [Nitrosomonadales bacterium]|nr:class I SAM-dependent methyltransferase [Nitrosomonadales bacterium]
MKLCHACYQLFDRAEWVCPACGHAPAQRDGFPAFAPELAAQNDGFDPELFRRYAQVEAGNFWFTARNALLKREMRRRFPRAGKILEIGCGTGFVLAGIREIFPQAQLSGSDIFTEGLGFAAQRVPSAQLLQMDATAIPFRHEFDLIGAFDVLEHIEDDKLALSQMFDAIKPGGGIILTVPQHPSLWSRMDEYAHHKRRYTRLELLGKMHAAGFGVSYATSFVSLLLPAMWASRAMQRNAPAVADGMDDGLKINSLLNALFSGVMALERALLGIGLTFPVGGSLLVVGIKRA